MKSTAAVEEQSFVPIDVAAAAAGPAAAAAAATAADSANVPLPHGWEKIADSHYGVYYIDHINKRTQYERPYELELTKGQSGFGFTLIEIDVGLIVVKNVIPGGPAYASGVIQPGDVLVSVCGVSISGLQHSHIARLFSTFAVGDRVKLTFARGYALPADVQTTINSQDDEFEFHALSITKGSNGFGFTISDGNSGQKVKKILDVDRCGNLRQGDILCSVNGVDLAPLVHTQVVDILKTCPIGDPTNITVKRKKRFRSKTPITLQSSLEKENAAPPARNCKTPSCEMMMRTDMDWLTAEDPLVPPDRPPLATNGYSVNEGRPLPPIVTPAIDYDYPIPDPNSNGYLNGVDPNLNHLYSNSEFHSPLYQNSAVARQALNPNFSKSAPQLLHLSPPVGTAMPPLTNGHAPLPPPMPSGYLPPMDGQMMSLSLEPPPEAIEDEYEYHRVVLTRSEQGFGFRIVGGSEESRPVAIGSITIGGVAHHDGILKSGDEIISINEQNVMGATHHHAVELMGQCGNTVQLLVRRLKDSDAFEVDLHRETNEGFGFVIISCGNCALIGRIIDGSPAQQCQRLRIRDRIVGINGQDISDLTHPEIINMIKESGQSLRLKIIPSDCYSVELCRGMRGYGFSIRGGHEFNGMPLYILRIAPDGPADSLLNVGDEIIEINGICTAGMTHTDAVQLISSSGPQVRLKLRRNNPAQVQLSPGGSYIPQPPPPANAHYMTQQQQQQQYSMPFSATDLRSISPTGGLGYGLNSQLSQPYIYSNAAAAYQSDALYNHQGSLTALPPQRSPHINNYAP